MKKTLLFTCITLLIVSVSGAGAYTVGYNAGTDQIIDGIATYVTTGATMNNMRVTVELVGGGSETVHWAAAGVNSGHAVGDGWSLSLSDTGIGGNTWYESWVLQTDTEEEIAIRSLSIQALPGRTFFDVLYPAEGTPNSDVGRAFWTLSSENVSAIYSNRVIVDGQAYGGDLYANLDIVFNDAGGFTGGFSFNADTDNVLVPIPATILLLGGGLIGLFGWRKRKAH